MKNIEQEIMKMLAKEGGTLISFCFEQEFKDDPIEEILNKMVEGNFIKPSVRYCWLYYSLTSKGYERLKEKKEEKK